MEWFTFIIYVLMWTAIACCVLCIIEARHLKKDADAFYKADFERRAYASECHRLQKELNNLKEKKEKQKEKHEYWEEWLKNN